MHERYKISQRLIYSGILPVKPRFDKIFIKKLIDIRHSKKVSIVTKIILFLGKKKSLFEEPKGLFKFTSLFSCLYCHDNW